MTKEELDAIEARANAATPGPWVAKPVDYAPDRYAGIETVYKRAPHYDEEPEEYRGAIGIVETDGGNYPPQGPDAVFIAAARSDVPALVAEVKRLREALERQPTATRHDRSDNFCAAFHGKPCSCGHAEAAKALGIEAEDI